MTDRKTLTDDGWVVEPEDKIVKTDTKRTAFGGLLVGALHTIFRGSFEYTVSNTTLNVNTLVSGGTVIQSEGMAVVGTSTTTGSSAEFKSVHHARYRAGMGGLMRFTTLFTAPVAGTEQFAGIMDEAGSAESYKNGYAVGFVGMIFGVHRFQNDVLITIAQADCDDPMDGTGPSGMTLDHTKINVFEIRFQYLGAGAIQYCIEDDSTGRFVVFHTVQYANQNIVPSVYNPNFHYTLWVDNKATTSDLIVKSASYAYFVEGKVDQIDIHQPQFSTGERSKATVTTEVAIFTIRNKALYASKTNFLDILIEGITASIEASSTNNLGSVRLVKNATLGGTPSYSDINATNSVVEIDTAGVSVTGGIELFTVPLAGKNDKTIQNLADLEIILHDGETITLAGSSANSATIKGSTLWKELL